MPRAIKPTLLFALLLTVAAPQAATAPAPTVIDIDRIVAVVNNDVITASELETRLSETKQQLAAQRIQLPPDDLLRRQLLERMIVDQVQLQLAAQTGVRITDQDVDQAVQSIANRNKMSVDNLYNTVQQQGMDRAGYREQIRNQVTLQQLVDREISSRISVSESEINNFVENALARAQRNDEYNLSHIFMALPESASPEQIQTVKARADDVYRQLKGGEDFARAAVTYSQGPDALKGGAIGWKTAGQLPELFVGVLDQLQPGGLSEVLRGPNGFHIVRLNDRRGSAAADESVVETHVRHILLKPSEIQSLDEARKSLSRLRNRVANGEDFAALARSHSEDAVSATNGGDLGWVRPRQLVPDFERAMKALNPGDLSEPVQSPFGVHLIQVLDRRQQTVAGERARSVAREQIHGRKADDRYEQWVRQLRDEAYVEYLLEEAD